MPILTWIFLLFDTFLVIDVSTDGIWCYIVLWVIPYSSSLIVKWSNLKNRLASICPSCSVSFFLNEQPSCSSSSPVYLLKFFCLDRRGLLHGNGSVGFYYFLILSPSFWRSVFLVLSCVCMYNVVVIFTDVTQILSELELSIQRVKVTTTPDGRVLDLFFITDNMWDFVLGLILILFLTDNFKNFYRDVFYLMNALGVVIIIISEIICFGPFNE